MKRRILLLCAAVLSLLLVVGPSYGSPSADAQGPTSLFGDGSDGAITFPADTQFNPPVDAVVTSSAGSTLTLGSPSGAFLPGQKILIHQTRGSGAGAWELNSVQSYALGTLTTSAALAHTYASSGANRAQVLVVPQYSNFTVNAGVTVSAKPWNGTVGGILAFLANGTITIAGTINANGAIGNSGGHRGGFSGGAGGDAGGSSGAQGEGITGPGSVSTAANGNGGGGGVGGGSTWIGGTAHGAGGGNGAAGTNAGAATGGSPAGTADLTTLVFGGAGGGGGGSGGIASADGGDGGGIVFLAGTTLTASGTVTSNGGGIQDTGGGDPGGGAGGSILLRAQTATLGSLLITATGGYTASQGVAGGVGRIRVEYCQSISGGFADPTASVAQISCAPSSVGGIAELPDVSHSSLSNYLALAALATAAVAAFTAGGWYARRRWLRQKD